VSLHHTHSGSIHALGFTRGVGQKTNPFLQIPLHAEYHYIGPYGIDAGMGVRTWEDEFGEQAEHLAWVSAELGYDVVALAREWEKDSVR
jgi:hypothetical protein